MRARRIKAVEDMIDKRKPRARRFARLVMLYSNDLNDQPNNAQRVLLRDLATLTMLAEDVQLRLIDDDDPDADDVRDYTRLSNGIKSTMRKLGLTATRDADDEFERHDPDLDDTRVRQRL